MMINQEYISNKREIKGIFQKNPIYLNEVNRNPLTTQTEWGRYAYHMAETVGGGVCWTLKRINPYNFSRIRLISLPH